MPVFLVLRNKLNMHSIYSSTLPVFYLRKYSGALIGALHTPGEQETQLPPSLHCSRRNSRVAKRGGNYLLFQYSVSSSVHSFSDDRERP